MNYKSYYRREIIRIGILGALVGIGGCVSPGNRPILSALDGFLTKEWLSILPSEWKIKSINYKLDQEIFTELILRESNLLALGDGWLSDFPIEKIADLPDELFLSKFDYQANTFLNSLGKNFYNKVFPIGVSPWVMLFRKGDYWFDQANKSWDVLLDPSLKDLIVLPESPRLVIDIASKMSHKLALNKLRDQCKIYDDRNAINWLLSGKARVAVVCLNRCWKNLVRDQRLHAILPACGSPLSWTVLVRLRQVNNNYISIDWVKETFNKTHIPKLLVKGWMPPLPISELAQYRNLLGDRYYSLLVPSEETWAKCWSLPLLDNIDKEKLERIWLKAEAKNKI